MFARSRNVLSRAVFPRGCPQNNARSVRTILMMGRQQRFSSASTQAGPIPPTPTPNKKGANRWAVAASAVAVTGVFGYISNSLYRLKMDDKIPPFMANDARSREALAHIRRVFLEESDPAVAFEGRSTPDLIRSLAVFQACQSTLLVENAESVINLAKTLHLSAPLFWIIKRTFFQQFCGGENHEEVGPTMTRLKRSGITAILDLSMESDLNDEPNSTVTPEAKQKAVDARADKVVDLIHECIKTASTDPNNFVAVKVTALGSTDALLHSSAVLSLLADAFDHYDADNDGLLDYQGFTQLVECLPSKAGEETIRSMFAQMDKNKDGLVNLVDLTSVLNYLTEKTNSLLVGKVSPPEWCANHACSVSAKYAPEMKQRDLEELKRIEARLEKLVQLAKQYQVRLMIDAEQTYFQPAIDSLALSMMRKYNHDDRRPCIYNTYQMYLKDGLHRLSIDVERSEREEDGFVFAGKLVRGAYMTSERKRAKVLELRDPIQKTVDDTHADYNRAVDLLIEHASTGDRPGISFVVASHNWESVMRTCAKMEELAIHPQSGIVYFAQLMGMHDRLSFTLAHHGFLVCKYIPFGPVEDVIPYLLRRAQENRSVLTASGPHVVNDRSLLWDEIKSRFIGRRGRGVPRVSQPHP